MRLPVPDAMPPEKRAVLVEAVERLWWVDGVAAVVLGGSCAHPAPQSDIDIGIYSS